MKIRTLTWIIALLMLTGAARAADSERGGQLGTGAGAAAGALLAGPPGFILGAAVGGLLGDRLQLAASVDDLERSLNQAQSESDGLRAALVSSRAGSETLRSDLADREQRIVALEDLAARAAGIELEVLFTTDSSDLNADDERRVRRLARILEGRPDLRVQLDGHADRRGTDIHNLQLSLARADAVRAALVAAGVTPDRIDMDAHGASAVTSAEGDLDAYALERRVVISLVTGASGAAVASR
jgi:outer membrane protein OmpA-like peptidoglycan-associated protein